MKFPEARGIAAAGTLGQRSTVCNAARELAAEARKPARREARKQAGKQLKPETIEHRARAQRFLKEELAGGPKRASDVFEQDFLPCSFGRGRRPGAY